MRILIATDAWHPQQNGVVRVLATLKSRLEARGHAVGVVSPDRFPTWPCPTYPQIRLARGARGRAPAMVDAFAPDAVHVATEGPIGWAVRAHCRHRGWPFTTAYHTKFPQYVRARTGLPLSWLYGLMRRFHGPSAGVLAPSASVHAELQGKGFERVLEWAHGVDTEVFCPIPGADLGLPRPVFLYVGRVTVEKNLPAFLKLALPGSKVVIGDGPQRDGLARRYPEAHFRQVEGDAALAHAYSAADVMVFPSRTDTFGLTMLEALACGTPVAAFPVPGPLDVVRGSAAGVLDTDLAAAARAARAIDPALCRAHALTFSWETVADQFLSFLVSVDGNGRASS